MPAASSACCHLGLYFFNVFANEFAVLHESSVDRVCRIIYKLGLSLDDWSLALNVSLDRLEVVRTVRDAFPAKEVNPSLLGLLTPDFVLKNLFHHAALALSFDD